MRLTFILPTILFISCSNGQQPEKTGDLSDVAGLTSGIQTNHSMTSRTCNLKALSSQFDVTVNLKRFVAEQNRGDSCILKFVMTDKRNRTKADSTEFTSLFLFRNTYENCDSVTSYSTNYKTNRDVVDNYYGDIVVADFNFDKKDDIAFITEIGGNGGPLYKYFLQSNDCKFSLDKFLTDSVTYFPQIIDKERRRLTTRVHAGACCVGVHIYQLNNSTGKWKQISHKVTKI